MYPSPLVDFGYDISDYTAIDPLYGTLADSIDWSAKRKAQHPRDHGFCAESYVGTTSLVCGIAFFAYESEARLVRLARRQGAGPASQQLAIVVWPFRVAIGSGDKQHYYHHFYTEQPDLNWRNPKCGRPCTTRCASGSTGACRVSN